jgi:peptidoglycan/xylan/chitin deacetylase (PgdA/CDA1 family)
VPAGDPLLGDRSLHLPLDEFQPQLDLLETHFRVVPLQELLSSAGCGQKHTAAITFDDAYRGTLSLGVPELIKRGLPATIFVPPGLLGSRGFWWDRVSKDSEEGIPPSVREKALWDHAGRQPSILDWAATFTSQDPDLPTHFKPAAEEEVLEAASCRGISLASHTWSHVNLAAVPREEACSELKRSFDWLRACSSSSTVISYPYGCWTPHLETDAREIGYEYGLLIQGGLFQPRTVRQSPFSIPRMNIPRGLSRNGFLARISGAWSR